MFNALKTLNIWINGEKLFFTFKKWWLLLSNKWMFCSLNVKHFNERCLRLDWHNTGLRLDAMEMSVNRDDRCRPSKTSAQEISAKTDASDIRPKTRIKPSLKRFASIKSKGLSLWSLSAMSAIEDNDPILRLNVFCI